MKFKGVFDCVKRN